MEEALVCALRRLGFEKLRKEQDRVVRAFVAGRDVFAALPTGYGKSLCFALLPYVFDALRKKAGSIVICVSPLTSLMMDQRQKFSCYGLATEFVGEAQQDPNAIARVKEGKIQLLYISPESLLINHHWREMLRSDVYRENLVAFVVVACRCKAQLQGEKSDARLHLGSFGRENAHEEAQSKLGQSLLRLDSSTFLALGDQLCIYHSSDTQSHSQWPYLPLGI